jgi:uncharacterized Tic20 family protein
MRICPKCGYENQKDSQSCAKCGVIFAKLDRLRGEHARAQRLGEMSEKALEQDNPPGSSALYEMATSEDYHRQESYKVAQMLSNFLYMIAALIVIATVMGALVTWRLLDGSGTGFPMDNYFPKQLLIFYTVLEILAGFTMAALVAAIAATLQLGRDIALNTLFTKEYLLRHLSANNGVRQSSR